MKENRNKPREKERSKANSWQISDCPTRLLIPLILSANTVLTRNKASSSAAFSQGPSFGLTSSSPPPILPLCFACSSFPRSSCLTLTFVFREADPPRLRDLLFPAQNSIVRANTARRRTAWSSRRFLIGTGPSLWLRGSVRARWTSLWASVTCWVPARCSPA